MGLSFAFFQRAVTAILATSERFSGVSFFIRAFALRLPSATAAGFFRFAINTILNVQCRKVKIIVDIPNVQYYSQNCYEEAHSEAETGNARNRARRSRRDWQASLRNSRITRTNPGARAIVALEKPDSKGLTVKTARNRPVTRQEALDALEALLPDIPKCMYAQRRESHKGRPCARCAAVLLLSRAKRKLSQ